ncbi:hypothetical protein IL306_013695 [Fusarium sp. DS 682]|nr:hypothetical protein IL306_013695 [Fusarium sp. DS 682]
MASESCNGGTNLGSTAPDGDTVPVIIAGAGPVGLLLALLLARQGIRSKVFEKSPELDTSPRAAVHHPPVLEVFKDAGIYDLVFQRGNHSAGNYWRKHIVDDSNGGTVLGPVIAEIEMSKRGEGGSFENGKFSILYMQSLLVQLLLEETTQTSMVEVQFNTPITGFEDDGNGVTVKVEASEGPQLFRSQYLVGCDGARSTVRNSLGIKFSGHSWPERMIATDVQRTLPKLEKFEAYFVVDQVHWGVVVPLEPIVPGEPGLWRYAMAAPDATLTDDEAGDPEYVHKLLLEYIDGPRPADYTLVRHRVYRLHQLLASTMHRGRVLLAGDAGHLNNPIGGLGLSTGLLDVDLLSQALDLILNHDYYDPQDLLAEYSAARRRVFQTLVSPMSSANKMRLQESHPDDAAREDWFLRMLCKGNQQEILKALAPLQQQWRTNIYTITKEPSAL